GWSLVSYSHHLTLLAPSWRSPTPTLSPYTTLFRSAKAVAETVAHSPLVKTALFASDPNWGRILAAVGRAPISALDVDKVSIWLGDRKSTRLNSSHVSMSYAVFCLKKTTI